MPKPINFETMMQHQLNEVISYNGDFIRHQIKFPDSHCFIIKQINLKCVSFIEKVNIFFKRQKANILIPKCWLSFFYPKLKEKQL